MERQLKVPRLTMILMASSAAFGMLLTHGPRKTTRISRNSPATKVDGRPQPPVKPGARLASPRPTH